MSTISEIQKIPTAYGDAPERVHESVMRAYHIVEKVKDYLKRGVPNDVLLELISDMEGQPSSVWVSE